MSLVTEAMNNGATHVLVVDDSDADRNLVRLSLQESSRLYNLECATRLSEGFEKLEKCRPDVILLDLDLPDSQGHDTVQRVFNKAPSVPILVLTGCDDDRLALDTVRTGAQDYIVKKNIDGSALTRALHHAIERHQVLNTLRESRQKQLEFKDRFLSHVSHELRSPLACIHQYAELMLDGLAGPLTAKEHEYLQSVLRNAGQLNNLINDLLDAASASVGKLTIEPGRVEPSEVIQQLMQMLEPKAKAQGVELKSIIESYLPAVLGDRRRLLQVFINLVENALKFTSAGGLITLQAGILPADPGFALFSVADTGKGINPENLGLVFDRLYQEQNAVSRRQGLGLGLAICKELVEQHGGRIWVESKMGTGSVFTFTVPLFYLPACIAPILVHQGVIQESTLVAIELARGTQSVTEEAWDLNLRHCRAIVERCMLPDKDILLPSMNAGRRDMLFVLACADSAGASVLEKRILGQLTAAPQIANTCIYRAFCIQLPAVPSDKVLLPEQLEWISQNIEGMILKTNNSLGGS